MAESKKIVECKSFKKVSPLMNSCGSHDPLLVLNSNQVAFYHFNFNAKDYHFRGT